jgi:hypothetical protein
MGDIAAIGLSAMAALISAMESAEKTLRSSAGSMKSSSESVWGTAEGAKKVTTAADWARDQLPGLKRRLAMAQAIEAQTPGLQVTVEIKESELSKLSPADAIAAGQEAAKKLKDADSKGVLDPALIAELNKYKNDPYYAAGLTQSLTPEELGDIVLKASNRRTEITSGSPTNLSKDLADWQKQYGALLDGLGTTIGTATRNTGELALPSDYAKKFAGAITGDPSSDGHWGRGAAVSTLLRYGNYSTPFLNTVATDVYNYERDKGKDGPVWYPRSAPDSSGHYYGPLLPDGSQQPDPLANIMMGLGHNPDAAQQFFDVNNPGAKTEKVEINGQQVVVNDRLRYLIQGRTWKYDKGDGLGNALQAATTYYRNNEGTGRTSATIASQTFALIGTQTGTGGGFLSPNTWKMWDGMRDNVAHIVADYMPDIYRTQGVDPPGSDTLDGKSWVYSGQYPGFPNGLPAGAMIDPKLMAKIVGTLGEDQNNILIVTAGAAATQQIRMSYALDKSIKDNPNTPVMIIRGESVPYVSNAAIQGSNVLGWLVNNAYVGDKADEDVQKKRAELISKTLSIATALPVIPKMPGDWSQFVYDQVKGTAISEIGKGPKGDSSGTYKQMDQTSKNALRQTTLNQLLQAGYLKPEHFDAANKDAKGNTYEAPPVEALKGHRENGRFVPDEPLQFNTDSDAYKAWAPTYADNAWLNANVYLPYNNQFPNIP